MTSAKKAEKLTLEKSMERLEEIATSLEGDQLDLEQSLKHYSEARLIYADCVSRLQEAEQQIQVLMKDGSLEIESATGENPGEVK